jgi:hypothetical protein
MLAGCSQFQLTPIASRINARLDFEFNPRIPPLFAQVGTKGVALAINESRDEASIAAFDIDLVPRWRHDLGIPDVIELSSLTASDSIVALAVTTFLTDDATDREFVLVHARRYAFRDGRLLDSVPLAVVELGPSDPIVAPFRVVRNQELQRQVWYRLHWSNDENLGADTVGLELIAVDDGVRSIEHRWVRLDVPSDLSTAEERTRWGPRSFRLCDDRRLYGASFDSGGRVLVHRIDPMTGSAEQLEFTNAGFNWRGEGVGSVRAAFRPDGERLSVLLAAGATYEARSDAAPDVLATTLNTRTGVVERSTQLRTPSAEDMIVQEVIPVFVGVAPAVFISRFDEGQMRNTASLPEFDAAVAIFDTLNTLITPDSLGRIEEIVGPTALLVGDDHAWVFDRAQDREFPYREYLEMRDYDARRGRLATHRLLFVDQVIIPGSVSGLPSGELFIGFSGTNPLTAGRACLVRLQPDGASRIAPVIRFGTVESH